MTTDNYEPPPHFPTLTLDERKKKMIDWIDNLRQGVLDDTFDPMHFEARMGMARDSKGGKYPSGTMTYTFEVFANSHAGLSPEGTDA